MYTQKYVTAESVTPKHPDKQCDIIADTLLDAFYAEDKESRVAIEVMGGHDLFTVNGEVTSTALVDVESMVRDLVGENSRVIVNLVKQSPEIARGVDTGGAGDQGIMSGYATRSTMSLLPYAYDRARALCMHLYQFYPYDGKVQVTVDGTVVKTVVASFQHAPHDELLAHVKDFIQAKEYIINYTGDWDIGGFDADTGLSGRKIVIDNYGPTVPVGGGSFSGKDYTKVDRSGAYMARKIAVDYLRKYESAEEVFVQIAYAIGKAEPVQAVAYVDGVPELITGYDLSPRGIREALALDEITYAETAMWGHFGRGFAWDKS
jgi:S-adenosylmethionine synthetase